MTRLALIGLLVFQVHHGAQHTFEETEKWIHQFESPERDAWQMPAEVVRALGLQTGDRIADIGAGSGYFSRRFARAVGENGIVYAVDIEPNMLRYIALTARKEGLENIVPVLGSAEDPMLPRRSVDWVFLCNTIHHIEDRPAYYRLIQRDLTDRGRLVIVDFVKREGSPVGPPLEMRIAKEELIEETTRAGFSLKEEKDFLPYQYLLVFERGR